MVALHKDPLIRRLVSALVFGSAFIWVAVRYFHVEWEVIWVLFLFSVGMIGLMAALALLFVPVIRLFRRPRSSLLDNPETLPERDQDAS